MRKLWTLVALCAATIATPVLAQVAQVQPTLGLDRAGDCRRLTVYDATKGGSDKTVTIGCLDSASAWKANVPVATASVAGVMSAADKAKLDGVAAGASVRSVAVSTANGIAASVANGASATSISLSLGAISPTSVSTSGDLRAGNGILAGSLTVLGNISFFGPSSATPGSGGNLRFRDDTGTARWLVGLLGTVGATNLSIYNIPNATEMVQISPSGVSTPGAMTAARHCYSATVCDYAGSGAPSISAGIGSTYRRIDGGATTTFYVKESGTGSAGWVAK